MYIVYVSSHYGQNECRYAMNIQEVNNILKNRDFEEVTEREFAQIENGEHYSEHLENTDWVTIHKLWTRGVFMTIYRSDDFNEQGITPDDRHEVFSGIMLGSSDFEATEINEMLANYNVTHIHAVDITEEPDRFAARLDNLLQENKEYWEKGELKQ